MRVGLKRRGGPGIEKLLFEVLRSSAEVKGFAELNDLFRPLINCLGFPFFACVESEVSSREASLSIVFGEPDVAFHDHYKKTGLAGMDPRLRHMLSSVEPAFLTELSSSKKDDSVRQFLASFRAYGHADCFIWPIHLPEGRVRAVMMASGLRKIHDDSHVAAGPLAVGFHAAGARLLRRTALANACPVVLRPCQLECLYWARQGKSSVDIGRILGISARTVDEHIAHACEALGVRTRIQAVARAIILGIL